MIYQLPKRDYSALKKASQVAITLFAFVALPLVAVFMNSESDSYKVQKIESASVSNATCNDGVCFDKHGRKAR